MSQNEKVAVLVSGGQDSTVAYHLAVKRYGKENVIALYVDINQPYRNQEQNALDELGIPYSKVYAELCTEFLKNVPTVEKRTIHGRNLLMTFYGALLAPRVWLSALENELTESVPDLEWAFFTQATAFYTTAFRELRPHTIVETPFEHMTKTEMIQMALENGDHLSGPDIAFGLGLAKEYLLKTVSCYDPQGHCGKCAACFKRWISWVNNGITCEYFKSDPWNSEYAKVLRVEMRLGTKHYWVTPKRVGETHNALVSVGLKGVVESWAFHQIPPPLHKELKFVKWKDHLLSD